MVLLPLSEAGDRGAYFLHEHPNSATSWKEACILPVLKLNGVQRITADQCQLGQEDEEGNPIRKPTGFMSNSPEMLVQLHRRCFGRNGLCSRPKGGQHAHASASERSVPPSFKKSCA